MTVVLTCGCISNYLLVQFDWIDRFTLFQIPNCKRPIAAIRLPANVERRGLGVAVPDDRGHRRQRRPRLDHRRLSRFPPSSTHPQH